jgi:HPt (histidine-containing phosphotransfer) domain-containing protein
MNLANADTPGAEQPVWDERSAAEALGGDTQFARNLLGQITAQLPDDLAEMRQLLAEGDLLGLAEKAHKTRGGAAYCCVTALLGALRSLDLSARSGDPQAAASALVAVAGEIERLRRFVGGG